MSKEIKKSFSDIDTTKIIFMLAIAHVAYLIISIITLSLPLIIYHAVAILLFGLFAHISFKHVRIVFLAMFELWVCALIGNILLGPDCSFLVVLLALIPGIFSISYIYSIKIYYQIIASVIVGTSYLVMTWVNKFVYISYLLKKKDVNLIMTISVFNGIFAIVIITYLSYTFAREISKRQKGLENQNKRLEQFANVDPLTELLNRRTINQKLELAMQRKTEIGKEFTVAIGDIDDFKMINDKHGHDCGDVALKNVSDAIKATVRGSDYVCRWGGEEILILFCNSGQEPAGNVLERIRKNIEQHGIIYGGEKIDITLTFGVSSSEYASSVKDILLKADANLYQGKRSGKNCVVYS